MPLENMFSRFAPSLHSKTFLYIFRGMLHRTLKSYMQYVKLSSFHESERKRTNRTAQAHMLSVHLLFARNKIEVSNGVFQIELMFSGQAISKRSSLSLDV